MSNRSSSIDQNRVVIVGSDRRAAMEGSIKCSLAKGQGVVVVESDTTLAFRCWKPDRDLILNPEHPCTAVWWLPDLNSLSDVEVLANWALTADEKQAQGAIFEHGIRLLADLLVKGSQRAGIETPRELCRVLGDGYPPDSGGGLHSLLAGTKSEGLMGDAAAFARARSMADIVLRRSADVQRREYKGISLRGWVRAIAGGYATNRGRALFMSESSAPRSPVPVWLRILAREVYEIESAVSPPFTFVFASANSFKQVDALKTMALLRDSTHVRIVLGVDSLEELTEIEVLKA